MIKKSWFQVVCAAFVLAGLFVPANAEEPVVGIYFRPTRDMTMAILGNEGIKLALEEEYEGDFWYVDDLEDETLKEIDVLILSCVYGYPEEWGEKQVKARIRGFAESGKGVILINESVGWRRMFAENPLFPEFGRGTGKGSGYTDTVTSGVGPDRVVDVPLKVTDSKHPVTKGVSSEFEVSIDMPELVPGPKGKTLVKRGDVDASGVIVGELGKGRVVLIAPHVGLGRRIMEVAPEGDLLKLLLNSIRWAGGKQ